jgi:hypothetical protein
MEAEMKRGATTDLLVLLMACGTAQAADWVSIGTGAQAEGKREYFIDSSSILAAGDIRRAWDKTTFEPHTMQASDYPNKWWNYALAREAFNCTEKTNRKEAITIYYEDGTVLPVPAENFPTPWKLVAPESALDGEMQFTCSWKLN